MKRLNDKVTIEEIEKWLDKIEPLVEKIKINDKKGEEMLTNMKAYISDCKHFMEKGELVLSFEAVVWAWAILENCKELGVFEI